MNNPLVSIIIPTYNRADLLGETLDSILTQTYENWECIIVDDGSTDNIFKVIHKYLERDSRFQFYTRPDNEPKGGNGARNYGFKLSKGELINWFDSDDVMLNNFLETKIKAFSHELDFLITSGYYADHVLENRKPVVLNENADLFKDYCLWKLQILTPSILFRKSFLLEKELFSYKITRGQETEFFSRLFFNVCQSKYKIINIGLFLYRQHEETKSYQNNQYIKVYKSSQTYIALQNFKRSLMLGDNDLLKYYYNGILDYFFKALENRDNDNARYILKEFTPILKKLNYLIALEFVFWGNLFCILQRGSYQIEKRFKSKKL
ncbi:glycosyltransferase family 2 protein [Flavobacterium anhuiense]|uniref:glycosyltransferase family 2 protein n=1 Tax=Flavobacterium anhuiense TaxID=459526 RepID=UPI003D9759C7